MKRNIILVFALLSALALWSQNAVKVNFAIKYGVVQAGKVSMTYGDTTAQRPDLGYTVATAQTTGILNSFFSVNDKWTSYYNRHSSLPVTHILDLKEGKETFRSTYTFHQKQLTIHSSANDSVMKLKTPTYDLFSILHYFKLYDFNPSKIGKTISLPCIFNKEFLTVSAKYAGIETIKVGGKSYRCHKLAPPDDKAKRTINIWLSDDKNRIPVLIVIDLPIVNLKLEMESHSALRHPMAVID